MHLGGVFGYAVGMAIKPKIMSKVIEMAPVASFFPDASLDMNGLLRNT